MEDDKISELQSIKKLSQLFIQARSHPDQCVLITDAHKYTYQWLHDAASRIQSALYSVGARESQVVAICISRSAALVAAILGCMFHGAVFLLLDPSIPSERLKFQIEVSRPAVLLYHSVDHFLIEPLLLSCSSILGLSIVAEEGSQIKISMPNDISSDFPKVTEIFTCSDDVMYIAFTSGSTGTPKAFCASLLGTLNRFEWMWKEFPFQPNDVVCFKTSINFLDSIWEVLGAVLKGVPLAVPVEDIAKNPRLLAGFIKRWNVTRVTFVPSYLKHILGLSDVSEDLKSLTHCISSGEPLSSSVASMLLKIVPACKLLNLYGTSEICGDVTYFEVTSQYLQSTSSAFVPIGKPIPNLKVEVLDPESGQVISDSSSKPGELVVYGVCVAKSYLNCNDSSLSHTSTTSAFNTHDIVHYNSSGNLMYVGRRDHQIKVRGIRINPSEIEAIMEKNVHVEKVVVTTDESHTNILSFVQISSNESQPHTSAVMHVCNETSYFTNSKLSDVIASELFKFLPSYMVPSFYLFTHHLSTLPSGKVNRKALPASRDIQELLSKSTTDLEQLTDMEMQLCSIFKDVLQLSNVSVKDNFFTLGGNSLSAVELANRIEDSFHFRIPVSAILSTSTIQSLSTILTAEASKNEVMASTALLPDSVNSSVGPMSLDQASTFIFEAISSFPRYEVCVAARCSVPLDTNLLQRSVHQLAVKHESLRIIFICTQQGELFQQVLSPDSSETLSLISIGFTSKDCSDNCPLSFEGCLVRLPQFKFDVTKGPLWQFTLFTNVTIPGETSLSSILSLQIHHLITDGWSLRLLTADLEDIYLGLLNGENKDICLSNPTTTSYFIKKGLSEMNIDYDKQLQFWKNKMRGAALPVFLHPNNFIPSYSKYYSSQTIHRKFSIPLQDVKSFCQVNEISEFVMMLSNLFVAIYALNGTQDIVAWVPNANRNSENSKITGYLDICLPVRTMLQGDSSLHSTFKEVKIAVLDMIENIMTQVLLAKHLYKKNESYPSGPVFSGVLEQLLFVLDNSSSTPFSSSKLFKTLHTVIPACDFLMEFFVTATPHDWSVQVVYNTDLYSIKTVQMLLDTWESAVEISLKHIYLSLPLRDLCQGFYTPPKKVEEHNLEFLAKSANIREESRYAVTLNDSEKITWEQLSIIEVTLSHLLSARTILSESYHLVILQAPFSAASIAVAVAATKLGCSFKFSSSAECTKRILRDANDCDRALCIVVSSNVNSKELKALLAEEAVALVPILTVESLLSHCILDGQQSPCQMHGGGIPNKLKQNPDMATCSEVIGRYFKDTHTCAVLTSPESATFSLAIYLIVHGVSVEGYTLEYLDSFLRAMTMAHMHLFVLSDSCLSKVLPHVSKLKGTKSLWIQGLPFCLAYLSYRISQSENVSAVVTHSLAPNQYLITHYFHLNSTLSIGMDQRWGIPIGSMCSGLNGKILHRDGREVCPGFLGRFSVHNAKDNSFASPILIRQQPSDRSFELISIDANDYYKGNDLTPALIVLSKIPEVSWCNIAKGPGKESIAVLYSIDAQITEVTTVHSKIRKEILENLSIQYLDVVYFISDPVQLSDDFNCDDTQKNLLSLSGPSMFQCNKDCKEVERIASCVSTAFNVSSESVWSTSDLLAAGGASACNLWALTIALNGAFNTSFSFSEIYEALRLGYLVEMVLKES